MSHQETSLNQKTLVIIDTSVVSHLLMDLTHDKNGKLNNPITNNERDDRIKLGQQAYSSLFWLIGIDLDDYEVCWVGDSKEIPYWRTQAVRTWLDGLPEDAPQLTRRKGSRLGYKGNRNTSPDAAWAGKRAIKFGEPLTYPGYEADDVAASIVKAFPDRKILLATVDSDWMAMITEDDRVNWCCLKGFNPQYRNYKRGVEWFENKIKKESKATQREIDTSDLSQIVDWKMLVGDSSDNLPAGTPREIIDLFEPGEGRKLWELESFTKDVNDKIRPANTSDDEYFAWTDKYGEFVTKTTRVY